MYPFVIDKSSETVEGPLQPRSGNEHHVYTYKDTSVTTPNSDTPYSLVWMDLRAEPIVITVPAVEKKRYYAVQLTRRQHVQLRIHR